MARGGVRDGGARPFTRPRRRAAAWRAVALCATVAAAGLTGCQEAEGQLVPGGNARNGAVALAVVGCGACHTIRGVTGAYGMVGPPLTGVGNRSIIAGEIANTPENMMRWIMDPQAIEPNTAMPNLQVPEQMARDMVAYLYSQH